MPSCAFRRCNNNSKNSNKAKGVTFHKFPRLPGVKGKWIKIIQEEQRNNEWLPTKYSRICSAHFTGDMFYVSQAGLMNLTYFAVPSFKTPGPVRPLPMPVQNDAAEQTPRTDRPRLVEQCSTQLASTAPLLRSPVRPHGVALPCEPIKVTSGPPPVLQKCQEKITLRPDFNPVITEIKSEADSIMEEEDPQSEDTLSLTEDTDQLSDTEHPSEDMITLSNAQVPVSTAPDPLMDVKVEELEVGVDEVEVTGPEEVNRPMKVNRPVEVNRLVEETRPVEETAPMEVPHGPLSVHIREELFRAGNDCWNLIRVQANQIINLRIRCGKHRQKQQSYLQLVRRRNKKISELQTQIEVLRNFIGDHGWDASSIGGKKIDARRIKTLTSKTAVVAKKPNRQLLIVKHDYNRPKSPVSEQPKSDIQTSSVGVTRTSDILQTSVGAKPTWNILQKTLLDALNTSDNRQQSSVGVKRTLNNQEKSSVGIPVTSDVLHKSSVGVKSTLDTRQKSSVAVQGSSSILRTSLVGLKRHTIDIQKPSVGVKRTSGILQKSSSGILATSNVLQNSSVGLQRISDIPQTSSVGFQPSSDIRQTALVIQIDGMHDTVLQPKLVRLDDNSMETG